jgi:hypothetical protein
MAYPRKRYAFARLSASQGRPFVAFVGPCGAKTPDFVVMVNDRPVIVEVGGRGKGRSQFKGLAYDRKVVLYHGEGHPEAGRRVPLHCLGFA